jgi:quinol monooxygenase YgiN
MRRRAFLVGSAAALLSSGAESNARQPQDTTGEVNALATLRVQASKEAEVEAILRDSQSATLANDTGCLRYEWYRASTPQTYILLERWSDQAAAQDHLNAPHVVSTVEKLLSLVLENPQAILLTKL